MRELGFDIAELRTQIEGMRRTVPNKQARMPVILPPPQQQTVRRVPVAAPKTSPTSDVAAVAKRRAEARRQFEQLKTAVDQAQQAYDEAADAERHAWAVHQYEPQIDVTLASVATVPEPPSQTAGTIGIALVAGLLGDPGHRDAFGRLVDGIDVPIDRTGRTVRPGSRAGQSLRLRDGRLWCPSVRGVDAAEPVGGRPGRDGRRFGPGVSLAWWGLGSQTKESTSQTYKWGHSAAVELRNLLFGGRQVEPIASVCRFPRNG